MKARATLLIVTLLAAAATSCTNDAVCLDCVNDGGSTIHNDAGSFDAGGLPTIDGSISTCLKSADEETCNELDDDCDGKIDEDFDLSSNPAHCGSCDNACNTENVDALCDRGKCKVLGCAPGFFDLDGKAGCEYRCPVFPARSEDCNALDDDCDGVVDEDLIPPSNDICRNKKGTPCEDVPLVCDKRAGRTQWFCDYPAGVQFDPIVPNGIVAQETLCDGFDNDCDGATDEPWPEVGMPCDDGAVGACRDVGQIRCHPVDTSRTYCDLSVLPDPVPGASSASVEICNGVDDDCDGIVDNPDPLDAKRVIDDMVHITHSGFDFWIYRYEAARPDSSATGAGKLDERSCSKSDALPWTYVNYATASAACMASGKHLCTAQEWQVACEGASMTDYPYGATYDGDICNGGDHDEVAGGSFDSYALVSGSLAMCTTSDGAFDMSGNVREWTDETHGDTGAPNYTPIYVTRGGSYLSGTQGLSCTNTLSQASAVTTLPSLGFRCCSSAAP